MVVIRKNAFTHRCGNFSSRYPDHEANDLLREAEGLIADMESEIEELRAALTPQWQPIETVPRDGTQYLASDGVSRWVENWPEVCAPGNWTLLGDRWSGHSAVRGSKFWMPLPAAPEVSP